MFAADAVTGQDCESSLQKVGSRGRGRRIDDMLLSVPGYIQHMIINAKRNSCSLIQRTTYEVYYPNDYNLRFGGFARSVDFVGFR